MKRVLKYFLLCLVVITTFKFNHLHAMTKFETTDLLSESNDVLIMGDMVEKKPLNEEYSYKEYVINNYDVNVIVGENNVLDVTEKITVYFNKYMHGIKREIPLIKEVVDINGNTSTIIGRIYDVNVNENYSFSKKDSNYIIKIGSNDNTYFGEKTYVINYKYDLGKDKNKGYDKLYYDLIGKNWDSVIGNVNFSIKMPKEFDSSELLFFEEEVYSTESSNVKYEVNGNEIVGSYESILQSGEALTFSIKLPDGYFIANNDFSIKDLFIFIPVVLLVISFILLYVFGKEDEVVETVECYPPEGLNSLEIGFLYKGKADNNDVVSLLVYLASKGFIEISETNQKSKYIKNNFKITKLKEYDGNNPYERKFFKGLFVRKDTKDLDSSNIKAIQKLARQNGEKISVREATKRARNESQDTVSEVTYDDLYNEFYVTTNDILDEINDKKNRNKIFEKNSTNKNIWIILMVVITLCLISVPIFYYYDFFKSLTLLFIFSILYLLICGFIFIPLKKFSHNKIAAICFKYMCMLLYSVGALYIFLNNIYITLKSNLIYLIGYILGLLSVCGMCYCLKYISKRTKYGNEMLGKIRGFKNYLETVKKEELEKMVLKSPEYFYDILPYTYVLDVSNKWIKKFETITNFTSYMSGNLNTFKIHDYGSFVSSTTHLSQTFTNSGSSSSSGGVAGGGAGGGGGSAW